MSEPKPEEESEITIRDLYPHMDEASLKEAEENLQRYFEFVLRVYERIRSERGARE